MAVHEKFLWVKRERERERERERDVLVLESIGFTPVQIILSECHESDRARLGLRFEDTYVSD